MKNSRRYREDLTVFGVLCFMIPIAITVFFSVVLYNVLRTHIENKILVFVFMAIYVVVITMLWAFADAIRRKKMVTEPSEKILYATERIAKGDFSVRLSYGNVDTLYADIMHNINKMAAELSKNEILKTEFISNVSHEIKTPLSIIKSYANALLSKNLKEGDKEKYLHTLVKTSERLSDLVTNILRLNKLENQAIVADKQEINIGEVARECVLNFEELVENKNINLDIDIDDVVAVSEPSLLELVFNNLISNAIKFTEKNGNVSVALKNVSEKITFSIKDDGCGMSAETGKHIFEKFYQGDTSHSGEGNGLGLALVKRVVDVLGGDIFVESTLGKGTQFIVSIKRW